MSNPNAELIIRACEMHGSISDPDHEVGDLQDALRVAFSHMTEEQQAAVVAELEDEESMTDWIVMARDEE